jgi:uncharacterized membrane protein
MLIFMSQAPILVALLGALLLVALLEMIGIKVRHNITVLSLISLLCLGAAPLVNELDSGMAGLLYAVGAVLAVILALYVLATARRGRQRAWFTSILLTAVATLVGAVVVRAVVAQHDAEGAAITIFALTFVPPVSALAYGLLAPDIPKPRGSA